MILNQLFTLFYKYWTNGRINYSIRVFIAFVGVVFPCGWYGQIHAISPLILGIIASALAETDDNFSGRLMALLTTLLCFSLAIFSVTFLFQYPLLFTFGLFCSTFAFTMLGALGLRYTSIAFASLLIAVYTMLGVNDPYDNEYLSALLLLAGALWYGIVSLAWLIFWPYQPVKQNLSGVFFSLSSYLKHKNDIMYPSQSVDLSPPPLLSDAQENANVVDALNLAKISLLNRIRHGQLNNQSRHFVNIYLVAQDIHERANASYDRLHKLTDTFFHTDVLFRLHYLRHLQAKACRKLARDLITNLPYQHQKQNKVALNELNQSIYHLKKNAPVSLEKAIEQLEYQKENLATIENQLTNIGQFNGFTNEMDNSIADLKPHGFRDKIARIKAELNLKSLLFRHALRLSITLCAGYGIIHAFDQLQGYWILLTILLVCQANYSAMRNKSMARMVGTIAGILIGLPLLTFFPDLISQLLFMILFGVLFFAFRTTHYAIATIFITLLVLMSFNQFGSGYAVMIPRLTDTLIGCALSIFAVTFIFPDWQAHRLRGIFKDAIRGNRDYLGQIIGQYRIGKRDDVTYRVARRQAHNNDAQLSCAINNMLAEPGRYRSAMDESFRLVWLNHTMLGHISTLGAHRMQIENDASHALVSKVHQDIHLELEHLIQKLSGIPTTKPPSLEKNIETQLIHWQNVTNHSARMILQQLYLIYTLLPEMHQLTDRLAQNALKKSNG